jgi:serine/threonine protein kinase
MDERITREALERVDPSERTAYLDEACAGDAALRVRVEERLRSHESSGTFHDLPAGGEPLAAGLAEVTRDIVPDGAVPDAGSPNVAAAEPGRVGADALAFLASPGAAGSRGRLGPYEVLEVVGQGGMGLVLKARDSRLQRLVAIKVLAPQLAASAAARRRFAREARAAAAVRDQHVVAIHAVKEDGPVPYLVMEHIAGTTLDERLKAGGPLPWREVLRIGREAALGLAAAHARGLVHRDVKPGNILLEGDSGRVKISDFGLARAADEIDITQSGVITGTPLYMSPEQARGEAVDLRSDLFSLGSVLYTLCVGRPAFEAGGTMAVIKRVCEETPRPERECSRDVPRWLCAVIGKLLARSPQDRFQSAAEVAELLRRCLAHLEQPGLVGPPPPVQGVRFRLASRRRAALAGAAVLAAALLLGGLVLVFWP